MNLTIEKSKERDIDNIMPLFDAARTTMAKLGIDQWQDGYPFKEDIQGDIQAGESYVVKYGSDIIATFMLMERKEPTYANIYDGSWLTPTENRYATIHRITVSPEFRKSKAHTGGKSVSAFIMDYVKQYVKNKNLTGGIKIDTHEGNIPMRKMLEKNDFKYCGIIYLKSGSKRVAYQYCGE